MLRRSKLKKPNRVLFSIGGFQIIRGTGNFVSASVAKQRYLP
jgi:hypothetical protein